MKNLLTLLLVAIAATSFTASAQSILTTPPEAPEQTAAREGILAIQGIRSANIAMLRDAMERTFPPGIDKQAVISKWGTSASSVFAIVDNHIAYLQGVLTAAGDTAALVELTEISAPIPSPERRTVHEDGSVTIAPDPTPTPTPAQ